MAPNTNAKKPKRTGHIRTSGVRRHRYGPVVFVIFLILIAAASFVGYKVIKSFDEPVLKQPSKSESSSGGSSSQTADTTSQDASKISSEDDTTAEPGKEHPKYEGGNPNDVETITGIINYVSVNDGTFMVRVSIDQTVESGTCNYILTSPSGKIYNYQEDTISGPSSTYCGLNKSFSELNGETGTWKISATVKSSNGKSGTITGEGTI